MHNSRHRRRIEGKQMEHRDVAKLSDFIVLDRQATTPLYMQLARAIRQEISSGTLTEGHRFPSENDACTDLGVSRPTLRQAFGHLEQEGLLVRSRASGTRVGGPAVENARTADIAEQSLPAESDRPSLLAGIVIPDWSNPFFVSICASIEHASRFSNIRTAVTDVLEDRRVELRTLVAMDKDCDITVAVAPRLQDDELTNLLDPARTVLVNRAVEGFRSVNVDASTGVKQAISHLTGMGHTKIGYVAGPSRSWASGLLGSYVHDEVEARDIEFQTFGPVEPSITGGASVADEVLNSEVTALLTHNDLVALGLMKQARYRGVSIPEDLSVVGFDNIPFSEVSDPPLTSIAVRTEDIGRLVAHEISELLHGSQERPGRIWLGSELVMRRSTAAPTMAHVT